ncbi:MAG: translocation/assembly module TamB domain-containing protein [Pseudomonadota bacterium]
MLRSLLLTLVLLFGALPAAAQTSIFNIRSSLVQFALDQISTPGSFEVTAGSVDDSEDGFTRLNEVAVSDGTGVWLTIDSVVVSWNATRLLGGALELDLLRISGLTVTRLPDEDAEAPELDVEVEATQGTPSPFDWPRAPIAVQVRELILNDVLLEEGVLPQSLAFNATGAVQDEGDTQTLSLDLDRTDAVEGRIVIDYLRDFASNTLSLTVDAEESAGGLVAELVGLPDESESRVLLRGAGPQEDWKLDFALDAEDVLNAEGQATIDYVVPLTIAADFHVKAGPQLEERFQQAIGEGADLALDIEEGADGLITINAFELTSPALTLNATGTYGRTTSDSNLSLRLAGGQALAAIIPGVRFDSVRFRGDVLGPPDNLNIVGGLVVQDLLTTQVDARNLTLELLGTRIGTRLDVTANGVAEGLRLDQIPARDVGRAELSASINQVDEVFSITAARLSSPLLTVQATGDVDVGMTNGDLLVTAQLPDLETIAAAYGQAVTGSANVATNIAMTEGQLTAEARGRLRDVTSEFADLGSFVFTGGVTQNGSAYRIAADGAAQRLRLDRIGPEVLGTADLGVDVTLDGGIARVDEVALSARPITFRANGLATTDGVTLDLRGRLAVPEVAPFATAYDQDVTGGIETDFTLVRNATGMTADLSGAVAGIRSEFVDLGAFAFTASAREEGERRHLKVSGTAERMRADRIPPRLLGRADLSVDVAVEGDAVTVEEASLVSRQLTVRLDGTATTDGAQLDLAYDLQTPNLAPLARQYDQDLSGRFDGQGRVTRTQSRDPITLTGALTLDGAAREGQSFGDIALSHDVRIDAVTEGTVALAAIGGMLDGADFRTGFRIDGPTIEVQDFSGEIFGFSTAADLVIDLQDNAPPFLAGDLRLIEGDLRRVGALVDPSLGMRGGAAGAARFAYEGGKQRITLDLALAQATAMGVFIGEAAVQGDVRDAYGASPNVSATLDASTLAPVDNLVLDRIKASVSGPPERMRVTVDADGTAFREDAEFDLAATVARRGDTVAVELSQLALLFREEVVQLLAPARLAHAGGRTRVQGLELTTSRGGRIALDASHQSNGVWGSAVLAGLDLQLFQGLADLPLEQGLLTANATFDTRPGRAEAEFFADMSNLLAEGVPAGVGLLRLSTEGSWDGRTATVESRLEGDFGDPITVSATLPLRPGSNSPVPQVARGGEIDGKIAWAGEIRPLWAAVPLDGHVLSGETIIDIGISGAAGSPKFEGRIDLTNGRYENLDAGVILTDVEIATEVNSVSDLLLSLSASDGGDGRVDGTMQINAIERGFDIVSDIRIEEAVLVRRDDATVQTSGSIALRGTPEDLLISGDINIDRAEIRLVANGGPQIASLGEVRVKGEPVIVEGDEGSSNVRLDLKIRGSDGIFARGRGLDSEWAVNLDVTGTTADPRLSGRIERLRGSFVLIGKRFEFTRGVVAFGGGTNLLPSLDLRFQREEDELTGLIRISGRADNPQINFSSRPALPEEEVMPRILFGRSQQSLSPGQTLALASGLATLLSGNAGPLDVARGALGVDVLQIDQAQDGEAAQVTVGQTLAEGVYVAAEQRLDGSNDSAIKIEIDVTRSVKIQGRASVTEGNSIGLTWSRDF